MENQFKNFDDAIKVVSTTGSEIDITARLRAKAAVTTHGMASIDSIVNLMREAATTIDALKAELDAVKASIAPKIETRLVGKEGDRNAALFLIRVPRFDTWYSGHARYMDDALKEAQRVIADGELPPYLD